MTEPLLLPPVPDALRRHRGPAWRALGQAYLRLGGWRLQGHFPDTPKCVAIVAPHTSNWDFTLGLAVVFALDLRASWLGKHSLFKGPFDRLFRSLGGIPVDRRAAHGVVGACVRAFEASESLLLGLAPEGTRKGASRWKTGFHAIATGAGVPIFPVAFDFHDHVVHLMPLFHPSGDLARDLSSLQALYRPIRGLRDRPGA